MSHPLYKRGDVWIANLGENEGSEQREKRPVLIIQNNTGNHHSPTVIVAAITDARKKNLPTHVHVSADLTGLLKDSTVLLEQVRTIDKSKLGNKVYSLPPRIMYEVDIRLKVSLGLPLEDFEEKLIYPERGDSHAHGNNN
jgi:mRNA interferase MazF